MVSVYFTRFSGPLPQEKLNSYLDQIPASFREQILRYRQWEGLHASLFGKLLLKEAFSSVCLDRYCLDGVYTDDHNKPLVQGDVSFNISHSGSYVVCALSENTKLGIDIEKIRPINYSEFTRVFTDAELHSIQNSELPLQAFYMLWAQKEAIIKADGRGMSLSLKEIGIQADKAFVENRLSWFLSPVNLDMHYSCWLATDTKIQPEDLRLIEMRF